MLYGNLFLKKVSLNMTAHSIEEKHSIVLVNYKTRRLTSMCLELLKKQLELKAWQVWVVDNDSNDDSLEYLRSLEWIQLIERKTDAPEPPHISHARALDMAFDRIPSRYVFVIHTDTFVYDVTIFTRMLSLLHSSSTCVGVGCVEQVDRGKARSFFRFLKKAFSYYYRLLLTRMGIECRQVKFYHEKHLKSFCALWDKRQIKNNGLRFCMQDKNPGYVMQDELVDRGYQVIKLRPAIMFKYLDHIQSGTLVETGEHSKAHRRSLSYQRILSELEIPSVVLGE